MRSFADVAPERLTTAKVAEIFGNQPFSIIWLSGTVVEVTYQGTGTQGLTMSETIGALYDDETPDMEQQYEVVFTGQALVNQLVSLCKGKEWTEPIKVTLVQRKMGPNMRPMWMLA